MGFTNGALDFPGTVFRLPLRTRAQADRSEICQQPFTLSDFDSIIEKLRDHLGDLLLFLRSVQDIDLWSIDSAGNRQLLLSAHTINRQAVDDSRKPIRQALELEHESLLTALADPRPDPFISEYEHEIDFTDTDGAKRRLAYHVVTGLFSDSAGNVTDCARQMLSLDEKAVPLAGAATRSDIPLSDVQGRVFCSLPLPIASHLGPCHVNGFFDLQSDRQGLFQDPGAGGTSAVRVNWNRLLLEHCCSEAAARLCANLSKRVHGKIESIYEHWPRVPRQEQSILDELPRRVYERLLNHDCIVAGGASKWSLPDSVWELPATASEDLRTALLSDLVPLSNPKLPDFVSTGFASASSAIKVISPAFLRALLRVSSDLNCELNNAPRPCLRNVTWVSSLLEFCTTDGNVDDLYDVPLAYMSNGMLRTFGRAQIFLAGAEERTLFARMNHWFIDSSLEALGLLKESKRAGILRFTPQRVIVNLEKVLPKVGTQGRIGMDSVLEGRPSEGWLCKAFEYMTSHASEIKLDGNLVEKLPLVTDQFGALHVMGTASTPLLPGTEDPKGLLTAISEYGVPLVTGSDRFLKAVRGFVDAFPDTGVWRLSGLDLIDSLSDLAPKEPSTSGAHPRKNINAILDYLATSRVIKDLRGLVPDRVTKLRKLHLFPTSSGQLVPLDTEDHHIPAAYDIPGFAAEVGLLDCGINQRWTPLYKALGVPTLTRAHLVRNILVPCIEDLSENDRHRLLLWLRTNLHVIREEESAESGHALLARLGARLPIRCTDGQLRPPALLYHPDSTSVSKLLGNGIGFPDLSFYSDRPDLWLEFFEELGMVRTPRAIDVVNVIDAIMALEEPDEQKANRISNIAEYVDQHWNELKDQVLVQSESQLTRATPLGLAEALANRVWLPAVTTAPRDYPPQLLVSKTSSFFKPVEMLQRRSLHLAGSIRPICRIPGLFQLPADIRLKAAPELEDVLAHFENTLSAVVEIDGPLPERFRTVFRRVYSFLGSKFVDMQQEALQADDRVSDIRLRFAHKKCLLDSEGHIWLPDQCFAESIPGFLGHRARVRADDTDIDRGLRVLGRRDRPSVSDYIAFFKELITAQSGFPVLDADRIPLRAAYHAAASLNDDDNFHECPALLESGLLAEAGVAVVDDAPWLSERARSARMLFLDPGLDESVARVFGIRLLSSAVYESPLEDQPSQNSIFRLKCAELETNLRSPQLCVGIYRLLRNSDTEVSTEKLRRFLAGLRVIPVSKLLTVLVWADGNAPVEGTQGASDVVFDHDRNAIVVSEEADEVLFDRVGSVLSNELHLDGYELGDSTGYLVAILRVSPDAIDRHLTKLRVRSLPTASVGITEGEPDDNDGFIDSYDEVSEHDPSSPASSPGIEIPVEPAPVQEASAPRLARLGAVPGSQREDGDGLDRDSHLPSDNKVDVKAPSSSAIEPEEPSNSLTQSHKPLSLEGGVPGQTVKSAEREHQKQEPGPTTPYLAMPVGTTSGPILGMPFSQQVKLRSEQAGAQRGRARTYVTPHANSQREEPPVQQQRRQRVDQAAVKRVMQFEVERGRQPKEMPHENEGYDIESYLPDGHLDRFIEVKGSSGTWADFGVALSRSQFRKASKEGNSFWLYVVEFALEPNRARVYAIQSPAESVDEYWFDGGWRDVAKERGAPSIEAALKIGSAIILDGARLGIVKDIRKRGALMLLELQFEDNSRDHVVYSPRRVRVLQEFEEEGTEETTQ